MNNSQQAQELIDSLYINAIAKGFAGTKETFLSLTPQYMDLHIDDIKSITERFK